MANKNHESVKFFFVGNLLFTIEEDWKRLQPSVVEECECVCLSVRMGVYASVYELHKE